MKILITIFYLTLTATILKAQFSPVWQVNSSMKLMGQDMDKDSEGNIYIVGITSKSIGDSLRIVTTKFNSSGVEQWSKEITMERNDFIVGVVGLRIKVDHQGNVYVALPTRRSMGSTYTSRAYLIKYSSSGTQLWMKLVGDISFAFAENTYISIDLIGNIYLLIQTKFTYTQNFLVKYDANGNKLWHKPLGGPSGSGYFYSSGLTLDSAGNAYSYGNFLNGKATFYKHDSAGIQKKNSVYQLTGLVTIFSHLELSSTREVYVAGRSNQHTNRTFFIAKMDTVGDTIWTKRIVSSSAFTRVEIKSMIKDREENLFILFSKDSSQNRVNDLIKYDKNGELKWSKRINSTLNRSISGVLRMDTAENIYIALQKDGLYKFDHDGNLQWSTNTDILISKMVVDHDNNMIISDGLPSKNLSLAKYNPYNITRIENLENFTKFSLYPNPAENIIHIKYTDRENLPTSINILNYLGQIDKNVDYKIADIEIIISIEKYSKGIYFLQSKIEGRFYSSKFIKN